MSRVLSLKTAGLPKDCLFDDPAFVFQGGEESSESEA
jgi:hypothetical protein